MYDEYDDGSGGRSPIRIIATVVGVVAILAAGWFLVKPRIGGGDDGNAADSTTSVVEAAAEDATTTTTDDEDAATTTTEADASEAIDAPTTSAASETTAPPTTAGSTTAAPTTSTAPAPADPGYDTMPDGSPVPVVAIYNGDQITITGAVPDQAAADRLAGLALANRNTAFPNASVANFLTVNPNVPLTVAARVLDLNSARFPESSAEILPAHAAELNRVVSVMNGLPHISVLVIGHADQRGDDLENLAISEQRALAVVNYLVASGIDHSRVQSRAVGEADLLTYNNDEASLAMNRRTEFVFTGLLVG